MASTGRSIYAPGGLAVCIVAYKNLKLNTRIARQARALIESGHAVTVVAFAAPDPELIADLPDGTFLAALEPATPGLIKHGPPLWRHVLRLPGDADLTAAATAMAILRQTRCQRFARRAAALVAGKTFDIVQAHHDRSLLAAAAIQSQCGGRLVFDAVEVPFDEELLSPAPEMRAMRRAEVHRERPIARAAEGWITVSDALADAATARFGITRPLVVRNCQRWTPATSDSRLRSDLALPPEARIVLHLNTFRPGEGVEVAVEALALMAKNVHLVVLGPEGERGFAARLLLRARQLGVAERLHLPPLQTTHALVGYASGADIGLIARQGEINNMRMSLPNRVFEMIAARLPIATSRLPEIAGLVESLGVGLVFDETDPCALAAALAAMLDPPAFAGFRRAVEEAARSLTWENESDRYLRFLEDLCDAPRTTRRPSLSSTVEAA
jgi:glycosyltransferase involved in cell wall biosynthesis